MTHSQSLVHWLEQGRGARLLRRGALILGAVLLTLLFSWKQFHGPPDEWTMQQVGLARQLAQGWGFTTLVNYPQTYAVMKARGRNLDERPYPEIHHAPLYPLVLAAAFAVAPASWWEHVPSPPGGWLPDYLVLGVNLALFWTALGLLWLLGRRIFDERIAWLALLAAAGSVSLWQQTVAVSGLPLLMLLMSAAFLVLARLEEALAGPVIARRRVLAWTSALGAVSGLIFLAEYSAGLAGVVFAGHLAWRLEITLRRPALLLFAAAAVLVAAPWMVRNVAVVGHPLGLAAHNLALKHDDITATPAAARNTASVEAPRLDLKKLGNKGLTGMERNLKERIWSGGGLLLTAFFVAGLLYRFRNPVAYRTRGVFAALLLVLLVGQPFLESGESARLPAHYLAPLLILFGAGFFGVLVDSQPRLAGRASWVAAGLLLLQALPLFRDCLEPRKIHFHYPPYFPNLFMELRRDIERRFVAGTGIVTDVPAGTAWYGRQRVWARPERLRDFYEISVQQPIGALLFTPVTLDRPFFTELAARNEEAIRTLSDAGGWGGIYAGLVTRRMPVNFPLNAPPQRLTENMVLLLDPGLFRPRGN